MGEARRRGTYDERVAKAKMKTNPPVDDGTMLAPVKPKRTRAKKVLPVIAGILAATSTETPAVKPTRARKKKVAEAVS